MSPRSLLVASCAAVAFGLTAAPAVGQEFRSYRVRNQEVRLEVHPDFLAIHPLVSVKAWKADTASRLATQALRTQSTLLGQKEKAVDEKIGRAVPLAGAVIAPRLKGLTTKQLPSITAALRLEVEEVTPVYRYTGTGRASDLANGPGELLVIPSNMVVVRFEGAPGELALAGIERDLKVKRAPPGLAGSRYAANIHRFRRLQGAPDPFTICDAIRGRAGVRVLWAQPELVQEFGRCQPPRPSGAERIPNDPHFGKQWYAQPGPSGINLPQAWARSVGTDRVTVAVVDDGIDPDHEDLRAKLVPGINVSSPEVDENTAPSIEHSHGTACAGIIGAIGDNGTGIAGVAWQCRLMAVRVSGEQGFASDERIAQGMAWAFDHGARVFNCSFGGGPPSNMMSEVIDLITEYGGLVVAAAGNALPARGVFFPANHEKCVAVGAIQKDNHIWDYSCRGPGMEVALVAPSSATNLKGDIWSTDQTGPYGYNRGGPRTEEPTGNYTGHFGGTSAASPVVAGVAALIWSTHPQLTNAEVRQCLERSAQKVDPEGGVWENGRSSTYGFGKVDAAAALAQAEDLSKRVPRRSFTRPGMKGIAGLEGPTFDPVLALADTAPKTYTVQRQTITLTPDPDLVAVTAGVSLEAPIDRFWKAVDAKGGDGARAVEAPRGGEVVYLVKRSALRPVAAMKAAGATGGLPFLAPAYRTADRTLVVPVGSVDVWLKAPSDRTAATRYAQEAGLTITLSVDTPERLNLRLTRLSKFTDVFDAAQQLAVQPFVRTAQPELIARPRE